jgi:hypothetical protein
MGAAKVHEFNEASKGMALPPKAGVARQAAQSLYTAGARPAARAQRKAMSKSKRKGGQPRFAQKGFSK